jgi:diketogulonate reductase-like aldo/keto reductase
LLLKHPVVTAIAAELDRTPAQVLLRWNLQRGVVVIPKSTNKKRIEENAGVYGFVLTQGQMDRINDHDLWGRHVRFLPGNPTYLSPGEDLDSFWS